MRSLPRTLLVTVACIGFLIVALVALFVALPADPARYHLNALLEAHRRFLTSETEHGATLQWEKVLEHRNALVQQGDLREVVFPLRPLDRLEFADLSAILRDQAGGGPFYRFEWRPEDDRFPTGVRVWCKPQGMHRWENALSRYTPQS